MASWTKKLSSDTRYSITLTVNETSTSVANNTSVVSYTLIATKSGGSGYYTTNKTNPVKVTINGSEVVNKKIAYDFTGSTPKTITLASGTKSITHEPDGTKTIVCSGYFKDAENSLGNATASGNLKLTDLHKPPEIEVDSVVENVSYLTSNLGFDNTTFINNVSIKTFTLTGTTYDDATITSFKIEHNGYSETTTNISNNSGTITMNFQNHPIAYTKQTIPILGEATQVKLQVTATDSMGGVSTQEVIYSKYNVQNFNYTKPTIVQSNIISKRDGQLTGKVKLSASGTYTNKLGYTNGTWTFNPTLVLTVKEHNSDTPLFTRTITTSSDTEFVVNNGTWTLTNLQIGTERGSADTPPSNWFDPSKMYDLELLVKDNVTTNVPLTPNTGTSNVLVGEPTWTEYKDRVDFKRITRQKGEVYGEFVLYDDATGTTGNITLTDDSFANYDYIEIFYFDASNNGKRSEKVYSPNNSTISLNMIYDNGTYCYLYAKSYSISGTTMTAGAEIRWRIATSGNATRGTTTTNTTIYRVVGYK